jgi:hypothetical protein
MNARLENSRLDLADFHFRPPPLHGLRSLAETLRAEKFILKKQVGIF